MSATGQAGRGFCFSNRLAQRAQAWAAAAALLRTKLGGHLHLLCKPGFQAAQPEGWVPLPWISGGCKGHAACQCASRSFCTHHAFLCMCVCAQLFQLTRALQKGTQPHRSAHWNIHKAMESLARCSLTSMASICGQPLAACIRVTLHAKNMDPRGDNRSSRSSLSPIN